MAALSKLDFYKELRGADLTHAEFRVLVTVSTYTDGNLQNGFPGLNRIIEDSCVDRKTAKRALRSLEEKGWLILAEKGGHQYGHGKANVYSIAIPGRGVIIPDKGGTQSPPKGGTQSPPKGGTDSHKGVTHSHSRGVLSHPPSGHLSGQSSSAAAEPTDLLKSNGLEPKDHDAFREHIGAKTDGLIIHLHKQGQLTDRIAEFRKKQGRKTEGWTSWDLPMVGSIEWLLLKPCNNCGEVRSHRADCRIEDRTCPGCFGTGMDHEPECEIAEYYRQKARADHRTLNPWMYNR